jgi:Phospholipase_D-nuclease N-terminal
MQAPVTVLAWSFGTFLVLALVVAWVACWVLGAVDLFRRSDYGTGGKLLWLAVLILAPFIGLFVYLLVRSAQRPATR